MGEGFLNLSRIAWLAGVALLVMVANIAVSIVYMFIYGYLIDPGHEKEYYDAHVQIAAPYCSIVAGIPLMFLAGLWISGWWDAKFPTESAITVWLIYAAIDVTVVLAAGVTSRMAILVTISMLTKLAAVYAGAMIGARRAAL